MATRTRTLRGKNRPSERPASGTVEENGFKHERVTEIQRARMLAAMVELVAERGAASVTVAHVVDCSGVSRRTFYEVFDDREDCFLVAFDEAVLKLRGVVSPAYETPGRWREKIRAGLIALLEFLDHDPSTGRLVIVETLAAGPRALERRKHVLTHIITAIDHGRAETSRNEGPPPLTAEGTVGAVLSVIHTRLSPDMGGLGTDTMGPGTSPASTPASARTRLDGDSTPLVELTSQLMSMIVLPYLGAAAARKELELPVPKTTRHQPAPQSNPLKDLDMRLTYRTVRVLSAIATHPQSSNRTIANLAGVSDQGQMSKLLTRLEHLNLIHNTGAGQTRGEPNAWTLTNTGHQVHAATTGQTTGV